MDLRGVEVGRGVCEVREWTLLEEEGTVETDLG